MSASEDENRDSTEWISQAVETNYYKREKLEGLLMKKFREYNVTEEDFKVTVRVTSSKML